MQPTAHALELHQEAIRANQRRVLVLSGTRKRGYAVAKQMLDSLPVGIRDTVVVSNRDEWVCERISPERSTLLMGRTIEILVLDLHDTTIPNAIGRATGSVDGGGLLILLCPSLETWPTTHDDFDDRLVVAPFTRSDVRGGFKHHLIQTLTSHPGISIVDIDENRLDQSGITDAESHISPESNRSPPPHHQFPEFLYQTCVTSDQVRVLNSFEALLETNTSVVVTAERGRGKSSAVGMAAVGLATTGKTVGITGPELVHVRTAFDRVSQVAEQFDEAFMAGADERPRLDLPGGSVRYIPIEEIADYRETTDVLFVDEAAGVPLPILQSCLAYDRVGFTTTLYGYEGTGHGFDHRFRETLEASRHTSIYCTMETPIRYAANDPIESWLNHALLLDARPAVDDVVDGLELEAVSYRRWRPEEFQNHHSLRGQVIGLLATAHYRTEPDDIARILDAPNLEVATLGTADGIVSVALIAREGNLSGDLVDRAYRGERLRGNMLPDIFLNEFRDTDPCMEPGLRIVRIATHPAARRQGFANSLIDAVRADVGQSCAWIGTGFGMTPNLVAFWKACEFVPVLIGTSQNAASGVHSIIMLDRTHSPLAEQYMTHLPELLRGSLTDVHREVDPDAILAVFDAISVTPSLSISKRSWRRLVAASCGPGRYDLDPTPARDLVIYHFSSEDPGVGLSTKEARLLVIKLLQGHSWNHVAEILEYPSVGQARRALGSALDVLINAHGSAYALAERERLQNDE